MRAKLEVVLGWLETAAAIIAIVVPATRKVVEALEPGDTEEGR